jgi:hypothetical protein
VDDASKRIEEKTKTQAVITVVAVEAEVSTRWDCYLADSGVYLHPTEQQQSNRIQALET